MSQSIVLQLVRKDLYLMRIPIICYWIGGFLAIAIAVFGGDALGLPGFILFVVAMAAAGVHPILATIVEERKQAYAGVRDEPAHHDSRVHVGQADRQPPDVPERVGHALVFMRIPDDLEHRFRANVN